MTQSDIEVGKAYVARVQRRPTGYAEGLCIVRAVGRASGGDVLVRLRIGAMGRARWARPRRMSVTDFRREATEREVMVNYVFGPVVRPLPA